MSSVQKALQKLIKALFISALTFPLFTCGMQDELSNTNSEHDILRTNTSLRAVEGKIASSGDILEGADFKVSVIDEDTFLINYEVPFSEPPAVEVHGIGDATVLTISKLESAQLLIVPFFDEPFSFTFSAIGY